MVRSDKIAVVRYLASALIVAAIVWVFFRFLRVNDTTVALTLLLAVLFIAARWGLANAVLTSVLATLALNFFFLPPIGTFTIADPENWVALGAFLVTALVSSRLSERARQEAAEARRQRSEMERLYDFSQQLLMAGDIADLLNSIPRLVCLSFGTEGAALLVNARGRIYRTAGAGETIDRTALQVAATQTEMRTSEDGVICILPVLMGMQPVGALGLKGGAISRQTLPSIGNLIAIAIERALTIERLGKTEAARESDRLRSALLDSVTHELRTPLTGITAAITGLRSNLQLDEGQRAELLSVIDEESARLNVLIGEAIEMAQLDAGKVHLQLKPGSIAAPLQAALEKARDVLAENPVSTHIPEVLPLVIFDEQQMERVFHHLIENAVKYSAAGSPITITAERTSAAVIVSVADRGSGIDALEQGLIFDKFYRGQNHRGNVHGTGMGLAIAKAIMEAHHGSISVTSQPGHGSVFSVELPITGEAINAK
jgi:two-component system sensor histidine kinase KdpD